ncbi:MAG TPA: efflux RND transporter permease subunit [Rhodopila sp.]|nr:efflux RND transporter permease subunit [Rhodopila sp.]
MNAIVLIALQRRLTFVVLAILILLFGGLAVWNTPTDIFPAIRIPVVGVVWTYNGLTPQDMSGRVIYYFERTMTTTVSNIEHIESQSLYGRGIIKIFFQPGTDVSAAQAQITASAQTVLKQMPTGITPPEILVYDASSVPVLSLQVSGQNQTVQQLYDLASNFIRPALISVPGVAIPTPYGGTSRVVEVDLNPQKLLQHGLSPQDVTNALSRQNLVLPAGDMKVGTLDFLVQTNAAPINIDTFESMPIKQVGNAIVYLRDVAFVHRGGPPQINMVLVHGKQAVLMKVLKTGDASTLAVVAGIKKMLPGIERNLPPGVKITPLNDASKFVRASVEDVVREMATAAFLTGMMVLLFLGSWRSTLIVATSIPLCILVAILVLSWLGQTINVMTLGGLALAVGILVDDATVMIENIASHLETGQELEEAIIDAANQIVIPTFVSTLCICIVWLPLFSLGGVGGYLFRPLAEAIVFAMIASFILSRTLVPTMAVWLLAGQVHTGGHGEGGHHQDPNAPKPGVFKRFQLGFERRFDRMRNGYRDLLSEVTVNCGRFILVFLALTVASLALVMFLGSNFFPEVRSNTLALHMRTRIGTRIEDAGKLAVLVNDQIHKTLPGKVRNIVDNCGLPVSGINEVYSSSGTIGPQDCDITITLVSNDSPVQRYREMLRERLPMEFPGTAFTFQPGDITAQILNFGLPAPIDIQVVGRDQRANFKYAREVMNKIALIPGVADANILQAFDSPTLRVAASRSFATRTGLTEANIADNALAMLSGSGQVAPNYWLDTENGVSYLINVQAPQPELDSFGELETLPIDAGTGDPSGKSMQILGALSRITQTGMPLVVSHYNITPTVDVYASVEGRDLGAVNDAVQRVLRETAKDVPHSSHVAVRGQVVTMSQSYIQLIGGLLFAVILVYLVIVVNFQSWLDPFIIITALPGALAGIAWSLFITHTTLSVPALTGAIMCMGTATANSILVVSFAREQLAEHGDAARAAVEAGYARIRPVLMTALAMIIGMLPMSMSNTQNAPLGRAVMGGLAIATISTLLFVPAVFTLVHGRLMHKGSKAGAS